MQCRQSPSSEPIVESTDPHLKAWLGPPSLLGNRKLFSSTLLAIFGALALGSTLPAAHAFHQRLQPQSAVSAAQAHLGHLAAKAQTDGSVRVIIQLDTRFVPWIGADDAWALGYTGTGQAVAILDTGVDYDHEFLVGSLVSEACYSGQGDPDASFCPGAPRKAPR